ncbi:unnamed protein product [Phytophthora lilii]|uniref:Unnamed protein product n=1 Tax=Phytophthora lilii TaxID=2077276 RepID=A0A9W6X353_9STRA|nr:unnamed protein product [Phytophthora lilii]
MATPASLVRDVEQRGPESLGDKVHADPDVARSGRHGREARVPSAAAEQQHHDELLHKVLLGEVGEHEVAHEAHDERGASVGREDGAEAVNRRRESGLLGRQRREEHERRAQHPHEGAL